MQRSLTAMLKALRNILQKYVRARDNYRAYLKVTDSADGVSAAFMEMIYVMPLDRWNGKKRRKFDGLVLVTDESLKPQYIADGVKICRLPMIGE